MSVYTAPKERTRQQYVATSSFVNNFFSYSTSLNTSNFVTTGSFASVSGAAASNCPAGRILRENGRKLYSNADPGVSTFMVGVVDSVTGLSGYIDPNASLFQPYSVARAADLADGLDYSKTAAGSNHSGPSVITLGNVQSVGGNVFGNALVSTLNIASLTGQTLTVRFSAQNFQTVYLSTTGTATGANTIALEASDASPTGALFAYTLSNASGQNLTTTFNTNSSVLRSNAGAGAAAFTVATATNGAIAFISNGARMIEINRTSNA